MTRRLIDADGPPVKPSEAALYYAEVYGWVTFPAVPGTKKSHKSAKYSNGKRWGATNKLSVLRRNWRKWPEANLGIPTGAENGFFVIDCDTPKGHDVDGVANFNALIHHHSKLPETLTAISPSGSMHYYFKWPQGVGIVRNSRGKIAPGVDVRGQGGMVLGPPSLVAGRGRYRWLNWGTPIGEAPAWLLKLVVRKRRKRKVTYIAPQHHDIALIKVALDVITQDCKRRGDWPHDLWFEVGAALHNVLGGDGLSLFDHWSSTAPTYDEADVIEMWDHCSQDGYKNYSIGTIFHYANVADPHWRDNHYVEVARQAAAAFSLRRQRYA